MKQTWLFILTLFVATITCGQAFSSTALDGVIAKLEKAIITASDMHDSGGLEAGTPYVATITPTVKIAFSKENFDADLEKAMKVYDGLLMKRKSMSQQKTKSPADRRISALMTAEQKTASVEPPVAGAPADYNVYEDYTQTHKDRTLRENQAAEADMRSVLNERQAAEAELVQKKQRKQAVQEQAMRWQAELDKQASASARVAAEWNRQHSFGAYARRFLGSVVQTAVGSFTTALLTPIATNLANNAVGQMFPGSSTGSIAQQAASQATRDTIMSTASGVGSSVGQSASGAIMGRSDSYAGQTTATPSSAYSSSSTYSPVYTGAPVQSRKRVFADPRFSPRVREALGGVQIKTSDIKKVKKFISRYPDPRGWVSYQKQVRY